MRYKNLDNRMKNLREEMVVRDQDREYVGQRWKSQHETEGQGPALFSLSFKEQRVAYMVPPPPPRTPNSSPLRLAA